jgi:hypothetical protein
LAVILASSSEYFQTRGGGTTAGFLAAVFQDFFGQPLNTAGQAILARQLAQGTARFKMVQGLAASVGGVIVQVGADFQRIMHRPADVGILYALVSARLAGLSEAQVVVLLMTAPENFMRV